MATRGRVTVPAPARVPHRFGLFSQVPVINVTDNHMLNGIQWEPLTCGRPKVLPTGCCPVAKEFEPQPPVQDAEPFTVMGSWTCTLGLTGVEEAQRRAREHLTVGEQQAVEWAVWTGQVDMVEPLDPADTFHGPRFAHPSTPVIGTVHCAADLLAVIAQYTSTVYNGSPLVHLPQAVLPYLAGSHLLSVVNGSRLETPYGTPLVAGAGYGEANTGPDGTPAPPGSWWVYVTGAMQVYRGDVFTPPDPEAGFSRCNNEMVALAERTYLVGWDCFTAAVLFEPCCECGAPDITFPPAPAPEPAP